MAACYLDAFGHLSYAGQRLASEPKLCFSRCLSSSPLDGGGLASTVSLSDQREFVFENTPSIIRDLNVFCKHVGVKKKAVLLLGG